jgi:hypothetical protein
MSRVNAVRIHKNGGPEELRYEEVEVGEPGPGEARIRHTAIGLNFTDIHHRTGRYPVAEFPHVIPPFDLFRLNRMGSLDVSHLLLELAVYLAAARARGSFCSFL